MPHTILAPSRRTSRLALPALIFSVVGLAALPALAQPAGGRPESRPGPRPDQPPPPVLRGPAVEDSSIPGTQRAFAMTGDMSGPQARMLNREVPMGEFLGAIRALNGPETPDDLHFSPPQREQFQSIVREFGQAQRAYMQDNRDELMALGRTLGFDPTELGRAEQMFTQRLDQGERRLRRAAEGRPDLPPEEMDRRSPEQMVRERIGGNPTPEQRAALERLREIRDAGPSVLEAQTKAWNVLNDQQQAFVQTRIDEARERQRAERGEMYVEEMAGRLAAERADRPARNARPGQPAQGGPAAERLHRMIDEMTPDQQQMLLRFLEVRFERRTPDTEPGRPAQRGGVRQPPPPGMDRIQVPDPQASDPI